MPGLEALSAEWSEHPPVHHLAAWYLEYKPGAVDAPKRGEQAGEEIVTLGALPVHAGGQALDSSAWDQRPGKDQPLH